jgi:hypothetical protein
MSGMEITAYNKRVIAIATKAKRVKKPKTQIAALTTLLVITISLMAASASGQTDPTLKISQDSGCVGDTIIVYGENFAPDCRVKIDVFQFETKTDGKGCFADKVIIPGDGWLCAGGYDVVAVDDKGNKASAPFKMLPSIVLTPSCGASGLVIKVHGDCLPGGKVNELYITFDDELVLTTEDFPMGVLNVEVTIPKAQVGEHTIRATTYYGDTAQAIFTVTPQIPLPEYPFGAIAAVAACIGAFLLIKKSKLNIKKQINIF